MTFPWPVNTARSGTRGGSLKPNNVLTRRKFQLPLKEGTRVRIIIIPASSGKELSRNDISPRRLFGVFTAGSREGAGVAFNETANG